MGLKISPLSANLGAIPSSGFLFKISTFGEIRAFFPLLAVIRLDVFNFADKLRTKSHFGAFKAGKAPLET